MAFSGSGSLRRTCGRCKAGASRGPRRDAQLTAGTKCRAVARWLYRTPLLDGGRRISSCGKGHVSTFRVWAPKASAVEVEIHGRRSPLSTGEGGWWETETPEAAPGVEYAFVIDSGRPLPDPRSAFQPHGVHGPSRIVDHSLFPWTDGGWRASPLSSAVIYELHVGTFTPAGTFDSAVARLDHLVDLGVTHVELMPVAALPGQRGW